MEIWSTTFVIVLGVLSLLIVADDPCRFFHPIKGVIDLTSLAGPSGKAAYRHEMPPEGGYYSMLISFSSFYSSLFNNSLSQHIVIIRVNHFPKRILSVST